MQIIYRFLLTTTLFHFSTYSMNRSITEQNKPQETATANVNKSKSLSKPGTTRLKNANESLFAYFPFPTGPNAPFHFVDKENQQPHSQELRADFNSLEAKTDNKWLTNIAPFSLFNISQYEIEYTKRVITKIYTHGHERNNLHNHPLYTLTQSLQYGVNPTSFDEEELSLFNQEVFSCANNSIYYEQNYMSHSCLENCCNTINHVNFLTILQKTVDKLHNSKSAKTMRRKHMESLYRSYVSVNPDIFLGKILYFVRLCSVYNKNLKPVNATQSPSTN
jgi:hypothetical protein